MKRIYYNIMFMRHSTMSCPHVDVGWSAVCDCVVPDHTHFFPFRLSVRQADGWLATCMQNILTVRRIKYAYLCGS